MISFLLAAAESESSDAMIPVVVGLALAFAAVAILLGVIARVNRSRRVSPSPAVSAPSHDEAEIVAVLTAAATAALGRSVRITDVQPVSELPSAPSVASRRSSEADS